MSPTTPTVRQRARRGRPRVRGVKRWQGEAVARVVRDALAARDVDDPESVTEATYRLGEAVAALRGRPLSDSETRRLRRLVATAKPSEIMRVVHQLNGRITDRVARVLATRSDISEFIWA